MISFRYKFIYIHIPKTAGNSIQNSLQNYSDDQIVHRPSLGKVLLEDGTQGLDVFNPLLGFNSPHHKHAKYSDYVDVLGDEIKDFFIFASIRNPFDRLISQTAFQKGALKNISLNVNDVVLPDSQLSYLEYQGKIIVNNFIRFERLQADFDSICGRLGLPKAVLPHKNASERDPAHMYINKEIYDLVYNRYKAEIDYFGYSI